MDLKYFKNEGHDVYELSLKGIVGDTLNGEFIAAEIDYLNTIGAKVIKERINSIGGGLINGFSIVESNLNSKAEIHTINGGMAGSIMSVVLASGTPGKRFALDYSTAVIHDPSYDGTTLEEITDEKIKGEILKLKESVVQIYANNTKMSKSQARKMMTSDAMLPPKEQLEIGLIDEILPSKMKPVLTQNMSYAEIMNVCDDKEKFTNTSIIKTEVKMSDLTKYFNLSDDATEASILGEARKDRSNLELVNNKVKTLEGLGVEKDTEISNLKTEVEKYRNEAIAASVEGAIKAGKYTEDKKEELIKNATAIGLDAFNAFTESIPVQTVNVLNQVQKQAAADGEKKSKEQKLGEEWQELITNNKPEALRISREEPKKYEEYVTAFNNIK